MGALGKQSKIRSLWIGLVLTLGLTTIVIRLLWLQTVDSASLAKEAEKLWENRNPTIKATRGTIYDRSKEHAMAWEVTAYTFSADPTQIKNVKQTASQLSTLLDIPESKLIEDLSSKKKFVELRDRGKYKYSPEVYQKYIDLKQQEQLRGIYAYKATQRQYNGTEAAHVLGFLNSQDEPVGGVESTYHQWLKGQDGLIKYKKAANGMMISDGPEAFKPPVDGKDLVLTLDASIQHHVESILDQAMKQYQAKGATAIIADPNTGEILAMASRPSFDPNQASVTYDPGVNGHNMAIESQFEPGSTFKIVTLAAAIEEGKFKANDTFQSGSIQVMDRRIFDWQKTGWGTITYQEGVKLSSNVAFVNLGQKLGATKLNEYIDRFGFGRITDKVGHKTGIDLPAEEQGYFFGRNLYPSELASTAFGQGISVTPIQQVQAVSSIANGGELIKPYIVKEVIDSKTKKKVQTHPIERHRIIKPETATEVRRLLREVVKSGTGEKADVPGYQVAGKTGTAQKPDPEGGGYLRGVYVTSFIGFAPADQPKVVVYVALDEPKSAYEGVSGGTIAAPVAKEILKRTLQILRVPEQQEDKTVQLK